MGKRAGDAEQKEKCDTRFHPAPSVELLTMSMHPFYFFATQNGQGTPPPARIPPPVPPLKPASGIQSTSIKMAV
jgi:hypothetical protein